MADETLQPLIRMVCRVHVVEEARHVRYAREELARQVAGRSPVSLAYSRLVIARTAVAITRRIVRPQIYEAVGIPGAVGVRTALANPHFRDTLRWSAAKAVRYLTELGLIEGAAARALWRRSALL